MKLTNSYIGLPEDFYEVINPLPVKSPQLIAYNDELAQYLDLKINQKEALEYFSGNSILPNTTPIALNYAGHQFGNFVHELGDGRATLLGEIEVNKERFDVQLKGSGPTKFSRQGDGRSALGPVIREFIISEAMHHLNIPTTRALAAVRTGEHVFREEIEPGGTLTRIAKSHIRVGTFEYFASRQQWENVKLLADYTIQRHFPEIRERDNHYLELLKAVSDRQSKLIAKWMGVGFIHGVMNTDNFTISGETKAAKDNLAEQIRQVNLKEHEADQVEADAASYVFSNGDEKALAAMHMYRVLQRLDDVANACEKAANAFLPILKR